MTPDTVEAREPDIRTAGSFLLWTAASVLASFVLVWVYIFAFPMGFMSTGYAVWLAKDRMIAACDVGDLAVFGDSLPQAGFIPARLPVVTDNLAINAGSPIETYFNVKRLLACSHLPRRVVISLDPVNFAQVTKYFWSSSLRGGILGPEDLLEILDAARRLNDPSIENGQSDDELRGSVRNILEIARFPPLFFASLWTGQVFLRYGENVAMLKKASAARGYVPFGDRGFGVNAAPAAEPRTEVGPPIPLHTYFFDRTIAMLKDRGVPVDFVIMPSSNRNPQQDATAESNRFATYLRQFAARYDNFHIVDGPSRWPDKLFADGAHLDQHGAEIFTDRFAQCLASAPAATEPGHDTLTCDFDWALTDREP